MANKITLRDGKTQAFLIAVRHDDRGFEIEYETAAGSNYAHYSPDEIVSMEDGRTITWQRPSQKETPEPITLTVTARDLADAYKEGFKMALGMDMMMQSLFGALGLDKEKVNQAIAQTGQIALEAKAQLDRIEKQQSEILEILRKAQSDHDGSKPGILEAAKE